MFKKIFCIAFKLYDEICRLHLYLGLWESDCSSEKRSSNSDKSQVFYVVLDVMLLLF